MSICSLDSLVSPQLFTCAVINFVVLQVKRVDWDNFPDFSKKKIVVSIIKPSH